MDDVVNNQCEDRVSKVIPLDTFEYGVVTDRGKIAIVNCTNKKVVIVPKDRVGCPVYKIYTNISVPKIIREYVKDGYEYMNELVLVKLMGDMLANQLVAL